VPASCPAAPTYQRRQPEHTVLYRTIEAHLPSFLAHTAGDAETPGLPAFVKREFERYLRCGILAHGFTRLRCTHCAGEHLLPFSCKRRGFCPSCGGRRMADRAAFLVDEVLPHVPVRQWVLTLPYRLRYRLAWDHALCRAVLGVCTRALLAFYARVARAHGIRDGQTGTVTAIQRFGSGLQLNLHYHTLVLDGVFSEAQPGRLTFHPAPPPSDEDVAWVLAAVRTRVGRLLARRQLEPVDGSTPPDPLSETSPVLARIVSASVQSCVALGPRAGARVRRLGDAPDLGLVTSRGPRQAQLEGFDLHANVWVPRNDRARLEQLCRYLLRPPLAQDRVRLRADGRILVELKTVHHDGEVLNAARLAQALVKSSGKTWDEVIVPSASRDAKELLIAINRRLASSRIPEYDLKEFLSARDRYFTGKLSDADLRRLEYYHSLYASGDGDDVPF
jgi:Transposase zinc-binding domain/Putative transposase